MDLIELRLALRRGWRVGLAVVILLAVGGTLALGPRESSYTATTTLLVTPRAERFATTSVAVLRVVLPNVVAIAGSEGIVDAAAAELDADPGAVTYAAEFVEDTGVLSYVAEAEDPDVAVRWSNALADQLEERYDDDPYLSVEVLDPARTGALPNPLLRNIDLVGVGLLSLLGGVLAVFALERVRESSDVVRRVRSGGLRVLADLTMPKPKKKDSKPDFAADAGARRLALTLTNSPGVDADCRFVVVAGYISPAAAVVDAVRAGLDEVGLGDRHRVVLGPAIDDLPNLHREAADGAQCVAVLDRRQRVDAFIEDVRTIDAAAMPVVGVVVLRRR